MENARIVNIIHEFCLKKNSLLAVIQSILNSSIFNVSKYVKILATKYSAALTPFQELVGNALAFSLIVTSNLLPSLILDSSCRKWGWGQTRLYFDMEWPPKSLVMCKSSESLRYEQGQFALQIGEEKAVLLASGCCSVCWLDKEKFKLIQYYVV